MNGYLSTVCEHCGQQYHDSGRGRPSRYCSNKCRQAKYRQRQTFAKLEELAEQARRLYEERQALKAKYPELS